MIARHVPLNDGRPPSSCCSARGRPIRGCGIEMRQSPTECAPRCTAAPPEPSRHRRVDGRDPRTGRRGGPHLLSPKVVTDKLHQPTQAGRHPRKHAHIRCRHHDNCTPAVAEPSHHVGQASRRTRRRNETREVVGPDYDHRQLGSPIRTCEAGQPSRRYKPWAPPTPAPPSVFRPCSRRRPAWDRSHAKGPRHLDRKRSNRRTAPAVAEAGLRPSAVTTRGTGILPASAWPMDQEAISASAATQPAACTGGHDVQAGYISQGLGLSLQAVGWNRDSPVRWPGTERSRTLLRGTVRRRHARSPQRFGHLPEHKPWLPLVGAPRYWRPF